MIEFFQLDELGKASFENVEIGDQFACIFYTQYGRVVSKALDLKVIRSGKRDVICKRTSGDDFEFKFSRKGFNAYCYPIGHEKVIKARESIRLANRIFKCRGIMDANRKYDAELMDAIEAFDLRIRRQHETLFHSPAVRPDLEAHNTTNPMARNCGRSAAGGADVLGLRPGGVRHQERSTG